MPYATFLAIHFEVGGDTRNLAYQEAFWPAAVDLVGLAGLCNAHLTLQFNPQWAEYILINQERLDLLRNWQQQGHEVSLHHHGYDHEDWNGYTNRTGKEDDPKFRGPVSDMMKLMRQLVHPHELLSGTITDEEFDYPEVINYDTEGIQIYHARSIPKRINLNGREVLQVGMAFLSWEGDIKCFKDEYIKSKEGEIFGVVTHEKDFSKNPSIIEEWLRFVESTVQTIETVSEIVTEYQKRYSIEHGDNPLTFRKDVIGRKK